MKVDKSIVITGMLCITALEIYALSQGINGILLTSVIALLAATIGVHIPTPKFK